MKPDEGYGAQNPVFPFPFSPSLIVFLNNIYEEFPRAPRENQEKEGRSSSLFLTAGELFWIGKFKSP